MKTTLILAGLLLTSMVVLTGSASATANICGAASKIISTDINTPATIRYTDPCGAIGGTPKYNPCVRTDATCGPYGDAWVYGEIDWGWLEVCVTSNVGHVLC